MLRVGGMDHAWRGSFVRYPSGWVLASETYTAGKLAVPGSPVYYEIAARRGHRAGGRGGEREQGLRHLTNTLN
jgi:hypothetical protein